MNSSSHPSSPSRSPKSAKALTRPVTLTLGDIAERLGADLDGDPATEIRGAGPIEAARGDQITFLANPRYAHHAQTTKAAAVLVARGTAALERPTLRVDNPYLAFATLLGWFSPSRSYAAGVHPTAVIAASAKIGQGCHVGAYVVVLDHVVVGDDAVLLPHVVLYPGAHIGKRFFAHAHAVVREDCRIGDDVTLQNGVVVGSDGFGFARDGNKVWHKIPQGAPAILENDVEVQANSCIDRASVGSTVIGRGTKIDNLVQVGHGCVVGKETLLCAQVGLAGSTRVGDRTILAGQVGVAGHCAVGDDVVITAQSGVPGDVASGSTVSGYPAMENRRWLRTVAALNRLPELLRNMTRTQR